jgi:hypothetical protein
MTSRKFLFGILFVIAALVFTIFIVKCSFHPIITESSGDSEIEILSSVSTTGTTTNQTSTTYNETTSTELETTETSSTYTTASETPETTSYMVTISTDDSVDTTLSSTYSTMPEVTSESTVVETVIEPETVVNVETTPNDKRVKVNQTFKGTYYPPNKNSGLYGGSQRPLIGCEIGDGTVRGSVACKYIYDKYKYNYSGSRTMVYIEVPQFPSMNGYYYVDDCCVSDYVIDFYWKDPSQCPFYDPIGVASDIQCWIVEE